MRGVVAPVIPESAALHPGYLASALLGSGYSGQEPG